jgi:hypothetical protein
LTTAPGSARLIPTHNGRGLPPSRLKPFRPLGQYNEPNLGPVTSRSVADSTGSPLVMVASVVVRRLRLLCSGRVQNGYVRSGTGGCSRPLRGLENCSVSSENMPARARAWTRVPHSSFPRNEGVPSSNLGVGLKSPVQKQLVLSKKATPTPFARCEAVPLSSPGADFMRVPLGRLRVRVVAARPRRLSPRVASHAQPETPPRHRLRRTLSRAWRPRSCG